MNTQTLSQYEFKEPFQIKILSLMVLENNFVLHYSDVLSPAYFTVDYCQDICREVLEFNTKYQCTPPPDTLLEILRDYLTRANKINLLDFYEDKLVTIYTTDLSDKEYIKEQIINFGKQRAIQNALVDGFDDLRNCKFDELKARVDKAFKVGLSIDDLGSNYFKTAEARMASRFKIKDKGIATGIKDLDQYFSTGGLAKKEFGFVTAPSSAGKSLLLVNFAANAVMAGKKVLYITFELQEEKVEYRIDANLTGIPMYEATKHSDELLRLLNEKRQTGGQLVTKYIPPGTWTVHTIMAYVDRLKVVDNFEPDILFVDYADIMKPTVYFKNSWECLGQVYLDLCYLAGALEVPVWSASQSNTASYSLKKTGENIDMEHVSGSRQKVHHADVVLTWDVYER